MSASRAFQWLGGLLLIAFIPLNSAHAQATRTWVSGVGDDANPCSRTAPCKTFAGAISKTATFGEINALDPGGFGAVTITKSISIYNEGVGEAGVLVSGTNGIVISVGPTDVVNLRGLVIDGITTGLSGVLILGDTGRVSIENCVIQGMASSSAGFGINVAPNGTNGGTTDIEVANTSIRNNLTGIIAKPAGGATVRLSINHSQINNNQGGGVRADGSGGGTVFVSISDSSVSHNGSNGVNAVSGPGKAVVNLTRDIIAQNSTGIQSNASGGNQAIVNVHASTIENNASALNSVGGGSLNSSGDNLVIGVFGTGFTGPIGLQ